MAKVTCKCCGEKIDKKVAVGIKTGKITKHYCPEHVGQKSPSEEMYDLIYEIFGRKVLNTILFKEMNEILAVYSHQKVIAYLKENKSYLEDVIYGRSYVSEYAQIKYFTAIIKNSIHNFEIPNFEPVIKKEVEIDVDVSVNNYKPRQKKRGMNDLLDELL